MMAKRRQKEKKKKDREAKAKARVLSRRHKIREAMKEDSRARTLNEKFRERIRPFVKDESKRAAIEASEEARVRERLEKNMQILKALEEEYEAEQNRKKEFNSELESMGHETLKEKLNALEGSARIEHGEDSSELPDSES
jgi:hypothetical protein